MGIVEAHEEPDAEFKLLNDPRVKALLDLTAEKGIEISKAIFEAHSKHEDTPPIEYNESWETSHSQDGVNPVVVVANDDPTAEWVEFGAHAGGKTPVLGYRVIGRTLDTLEGGVI